MRHNPVGDAGRAAVRLVEHNPSAPHTWTFGGLLDNAKSVAGTAGSAILGASYGSRFGPLGAVAGGLLGAGGSLATGYFQPQTS